MNISTKQKQTHRYRGQTCGCQGGGGVRGGKDWEFGGQQMQTIINRMDTQQGPTVWHRELYLVSCDKPQWKRI